MNIVPHRLNERVRRRRTEAIGELATLPVFLKLRGRRVVVAGGSDAAAWKVELAAAAGATVDVFAPVVGDALQSLNQDTGAGRCIRIRNRPWNKGDLSGSALAVGDFGCATAAAAFRQACQRSGVPVNVIDQPEFCDVQFGSIVNRGPVVVGISTDGAAPILGQAIRRRIEALLPGFVAEWAEIAGQVRAQVNRTLAPGKARRIFWERFVDRTFAGPPDAASIETVLQDCRHVSQDKTIGAGGVLLVETPGDDVEALTIGAVRALQRADILLFSSGVPADVLELARREATRRFLGRSLPAQDLLGWTASGKTVVLAVVSGRETSETKDWLVAAGIEFTRI